MDLESRGVVLSVRSCTIRVTAKLICVFVFAYTDCWFSHAAAHMKTNTIEIILSGVIAFENFSHMDEFVMRQQRHALTFHFILTDNFK